MSFQLTFKHGLILGSFCLGFGTLLAMTNDFTVNDIAKRAVEDRQNTLSQVIPNDMHDNNLVADTVTVKNQQGNDVLVYRATKDGKLTGLAYEISSTKGYSGLIKLMMGIAPDGKIIGVRVLEHHETPGLGDKIEEKKGDWILKFTGLSLGNPPLEKWKVKKDGGQFDQFAGATITPRAVVGAITDGLKFFDANKDKLLEEKTTPTPNAGGDKK